MGRAKIVVPPPVDFVPVPLEHTGHLEVSSVEEPVVEEVTETEEVSTWVSGDMREEEDIPEEEYINEEELERERIAQEKHQEILRQRTEAEIAAKEEAEKNAIILQRAQEILDNPPVITEYVVDPDIAIKLKNQFITEQQTLVETHEKELEELRTKIETLEKTNPSNTNLLAQISQLKTDNERLAKEKEAAEKAREQQILSMRQKASETRGQNVQMNLVKDRRPSLFNRLKNYGKEFLKKRRMEKAITVTVAGYETAIIHRVKIAVPKMLDDMEKMHEQLSILETLVEKYTKTIDTKGR